MSNAEFFKFYLVLSSVVTVFCLSFAAAMRKESRAGFWAIIAMVAAVWIFGAFGVWRYFAI